MIRLVADGKIELRRNLVAISRGAHERFAQNALGLACPILIGCVKQSDAMIQRGMNATNRPVALNPASHGEPTAKTQNRNFKSTVAEAARVHAPPLTP